MPFSGPGDPKLPTNVQKLIEAQRDKWVKTWNSTFANCRSPKTGGAPGTVEHCEGIAFRIANGTIKKEVEVVEEAKVEEQKDHMDRPGGPVPVVIVEESAPQGPFGGAQSFEELEQYRAAAEQAQAVAQTTLETKLLMENVMDSDEELAVKPGKIRTIANGFQRRVAEILTDMAKVLNPEADKQATKTEGGVLFRQTDFAVVGDPQKPSTWKLRLAEGSSGKFTVRQVAAAITAMQPGGFRGQRVQFSPGEKLQAVKRISAAINKTEGNDDQKENLRRRLNRVKDLSTPAFQITKDKDGNMRWIGFPTNKWRDRDEPPQIIEERAHLEFVKYLEDSKDFPVLLSWHTPGTKMGVADWVDYSNGFLIMSGTIDKDKHAEAEKLAEKCRAGDLGMSHGFVYTYSDEKKEIIGHYRTWEVSHLPIAHAANVWTSLDILKKEVGQMSFDPEKRKYLVELHGEDVVAAIEAKTVDLGKDLLSAGVEFKDVTGENESPEPNELVSQTAKAIVESDSFKGLTKALVTLTEGIKELKETSIPDIVRRLEAVEAKAEATETKATKTADDIIAEALEPRNQSFQASKKGEEPSKEDKKKEEETKVETPIHEDMVAGMLGPQT